MSVPLKTKILLADDHAVVRDGLRMVLDSQPDLEVVAQAGDGAEALSLGLDQQIDLAVLDVSMPRMTGLQTARELSRRRPELRIVMLSMHDKEQYFFEALKAGAAGYVLKSAANRDLIEACRAAMRGEPFLYPAAVTALIRDFLDRARRGEAGPDDPLTAREQEVVKLIAEGLTSDEIAESLDQQQDGGPPPGERAREARHAQSGGAHALRHPARARRTLSARRWSSGAPRSAHLTPWSRAAPSHSMWPPPTQRREPCPASWSGSASPTTRRRSPRSRTAWPAPLGLPLILVHATNGDEPTGELLERFDPRSGVGSELRTTVGEPAQALARVALEEDAALIVIGTGSRAPLRRLFAKGTASAVMDAESRPVLLVPPAAIERERAPRPIAPSAIVCALDESPESRRVARYAAAFATVTLKRLVLLHDGPLPQGLPDHADFDTRAVDGRPSEWLEVIGAEENAGLAVVSGSKREAGSVATWSSRPVLVVPPATVDEAIDSLIAPALGANNAERAMGAAADLL